MDALQPLQAPAMQFISSAPQPKPEKETKKAETRSRRVNVMLLPSIYSQLKERAEKNRRSVNDMINIMLSDALNKEDRE